MKKESREPIRRSLAILSTLSLLSSSAGAAGLATSAAGKTANGAGAAPLASPVLPMGGGGRSSLNLAPAPGLYGSLGLPFTPPLATNVHGGQPEDSLRPDTPAQTPSPRRAGPGASAETLEPAPALLPVARTAAAEEGRTQAPDMPERRLAQDPGRTTAAGDGEARVQGAMETIEGLDASLGKGGEAGSAEALDAVFSGTPRAPAALPAAHDPQGSGGADMPDVRRAALSSPHGEDGGEGGKRDARAPPGTGRTKLLLQASLAPVPLRDYLRATGRRLIRSGEASRISEELEGLRAMVEGQSLPEDGGRSIHLMVVDDMRPDAVFVALPGGDRAMVVTLGLLRFVANDDELRFVTGHELSHGVSDIQAEIERVKKADPDSVLPTGLQRSVENEVDAKSAVERVHRKGGNPYGGIHFLERLRETGLIPDGSIQSRIDTLSMAITGLKRQYGEAVKEDRPGAFGTDLVAGLQSKLFGAPGFRKGRMDAIEAALAGLKAPEAHAAYARALHGTLDTRGAGKLYPRAYQHRWSEVERLGYGLLNASDRVRLRQALHARLDGLYEAARDAVLGGRPVPAAGRQIRQFMALDDRSYALDDLDAVELMRRLREAQSTAGSAEELALKTETPDERLAHASRAHGARRKLADLDARLDAALGAYDLPPDEMRALIAHAFEGSPMDYGGKQAARQAAIPHLRHIGPAISRNEARNLALRRDNVDVLLAPTATLEDFYQNVRAVFSLPSSEWKPWAGRALDAYIESSRRRLGKAGTPEEARQALREIDGAWGWRDPTAVDLALIEEWRADPRPTAERLGGHFLRLLRAAPDMEAFEELMNHGDVDREGALVISAPRGVFVSPELAKEMFSSESFRDAYLAALAGTLEREVARAASFEDATRAVDRHTGILSMLESKGLATAAHQGSPAFRAAMAEVERLLALKSRAKLSAGRSSPVPERMGRSFAIAAHPAFFTLPGASGIDRAAVKEDLLAIAQDPDASRNAYWTLCFPSVRRLLFLEGRTQEAHALLAALSRLIDFNRHHRGVEAPAGFTKEDIAEEAAAWGDWLRSKGPGSQRLAARVFSPDVRIGPDAESAEYKHFAASSDAFLDEVFQGGLKKHAEKPYRERVAAAIYDTWLTVAPWRHYWVNEVIRSWYPKEVQEQMEFFLGYTAGMKRYLEDAKRTALGQPSPVPDYDSAVGKARNLAKIQGKTGVDLAAFILDFTEPRYFTEPIDAFFKNDGDFRKVKPLTLLAVMKARGSPADNDEIFEHLWKEKDRDAELRAALLDEELVRALHYSENQELLAKWQLEERFGLSRLKDDLVANRVQRPGRSGVREVVREVQSAIEKQFSDRSETRNGVLSHAQDHLLTNLDETRQMDALRLSQANWFENRALVAIDAPQWLSGLARTNFDKLELIRYLTGQTDELPGFAIGRIESMAARGEKPLDWIEKAREAFRQAPRHVRTYVLMPLLDPAGGILSEPALADEAYKMLVGESLDDPVVNALFRAYYGNLPLSERHVLLAHVLGTLVERRAFQPSIQKGLRGSAESLGIDAGRFIEEAGLITDDISREAEYFLRRLSRHARELPWWKRAWFWASFARAVGDPKHRGTDALLAASNARAGLKGAVRANVDYSVNLTEKMDRFADALRARLAVIPARKRGRWLSRLSDSVTPVQISEPAPVRNILEAMGPFGIKAGQFLRSSGLVGREIRKQLDDFFDDALRPTRGEILQKLQQAFGDRLGPIEFVSQTLGSGSINFAVLAEARNPRTGRLEMASIRFRRDGTVGRIANENAIWQRAVADLRSDPNKTVRRMGDVLDQARRHSMETLGPGGAEMDHRIEPSYYEEVRRAYERGPDPRTGYRIEVVQPNHDLIALVPEGLRDQVSVFDFIPNTRLKKLSGEDRARFAAQIFDAELRAMLDFGVFDPDGHPGNWLIDTENKRLVRIDYPQLRSYGPAEMMPFSRTLRTILLPGASPGMARTLHQHFERVFDIRGPYSTHLRQAVRKAVLTADFPPFSLPHERLFHIQDRVQKYFDDRGVDVTVSLSPATRSAMGSLSRTAIYREHMGDGAYLNVLSGRLGASPTLLRMAAAAHAAIAWGPVGRKMYQLLLDGSRRLERALRK